MNGYGPIPLTPIIKELMWLKILEKANAEYWKSMGPSRYPSSQE